jgi:hypothetical protein
LLALVCLRVFVFEWCDLDGCGFGIVLFVTRIWFACFFPGGAGAGGAADVLFTELWKACAGPLVNVPAVGERVFYLPQGHIEQVKENGGDADAKLGGLLLLFCFFREFCVFPFLRNLGRSRDRCEIALFWEVLARGLRNLVVVLFLDLEIPIRQKLGVLPYRIS